jgi:hypothetical protein
VPVFITGKLASPSVNKYCVINIICLSRDRNLLTFAVFNLCENSIVGHCREEECAET